MTRTGYCCGLPTQFMRFRATERGANLVFSLLSSGYFASSSHVALQITHGEEKSAGVQTHLVASPLTVFGGKV